MNRIILKKCIPKNIDGMEGEIYTYLDLCDNKSIDENNIIIEKQFSDCVVNYHIYKQNNIYICCSKYRNVDHNVIEYYRQSNNPEIFIKI